MHIFTMKYRKGNETKKVKININKPLEQIVIKCNILVLQGYSVYKVKGLTEHLDKNGLELQNYLKGLLISLPALLYNMTVLLDKPYLVGKKEAAEFVTIVLETIAQSKMVEEHFKG